VVKDFLVIARWSAVTTWRSQRSFLVIASGATAQRPARKRSQTWTIVVFPHPPTRNIPPRLLPFGRNDKTRLNLNMKTNYPLLRLSTLKHKKGADCRSAALEPIIHFVIARRSAATTWRSQKSFLAIASGATAQRPARKRSQTWTIVVFSHQPTRNIPPRLLPFGRNNNIIKFKIGADCRFAALKPTTFAKHPRNEMQGAGWEPSQ